MEQNDELREETCKYGRQQIHTIIYQHIGLDSRLIETSLPDMPNIYTEGERSD